MLMQFKESLGEKCSIKECMDNPPLTFLQIVLFFDASVVTDPGKK